MKATKTATFENEDNTRAETRLQAYHDSNASFHFERTRLNGLFVEATRYPMVLVCAGAGYGKTTAVRDFTQNYQADIVWIQLSERDNVGARFWEKYTYTMSQVNKPYAKAIGKLAFPDTQDKLNQCMALARHHVELKTRIFVMDDFHVIEDPDVIRFVEYAFINMPPGNTLFLVSRSTPRVNTASLVSRGHIFNMGEGELRFTENELSQYFRRLDITLHPNNLREIMQDTEGWAFAINFIARSYRKAPGYGGYLRSAMKANIFRLMEAEIWDGISGRLQIFLIRLSLIDHLSVDLIVLLAGPDKDLVSEMERQNAYVSRDNYINAYLIHPLFLEFLAAKQELLSEEQKRETYTIAGKWCNKNGFKIDAMTYYEKIGDYKSITGIFMGSQSQIPYDIACYAEAIFKRTPPEFFDTVAFLASTHIRAIMCQGRWKDVIKLAEYYEARYQKLPVDEEFRKLTLSSIYCCWGLARSLMCLADDVYDFDLYYEKVDQCFSEPLDPGLLINKNPEGSWICIVGSSRKGAPEEYLAALKRSTAHLSRCFIGFETGRYELATGELLFYKNDIDASETHIARALNIAREKKQFALVHRALFYLLRIAFLRGNYTRAEQTTKEIKDNLDEAEYFNRFIDYDIFLCWYYCVMDLPKKTPDWLKDNFSLYAHASFVENSANQMKAFYCFVTRDYPPLLSYIQEMKQRESFLFERLEMLMLEACVYYKMKDRKKACAVLYEAYQTASPNDLLLPFIEIGKDMRTLTAFALKETDCGIPKSWLESINRKSASCAKRRARIIAGYKQSHGMANDIVISPRESEILNDLSLGLSRNEIASSRSLSNNTVKMIINNIYFKLGAENMADAIRIAAERRLI